MSIAKLTNHIGMLSGRISRLRNSLSIGQGRLTPESIEDTLSLVRELEEERAYLGDIAQVNDLLQTRLEAERHRVHDDDSGLAAQIDWAIAQCRKGI